MEFKTNSGIWGTMFGVPCIVADNFLKLADEAQIKVLLYLLRNSDRTVSAEDISANTGVSVQQVGDAVLFWQQVNVLSQDASFITSVAPTPIQPLIEQPAAAEIPQPKPISQPVSNVPPKKSMISPSEISAIVTKDQNIAELFKIAESLLGTLNHAMQNSLIWMFNYLGLKKEVILILLSNCIDINKTNPSYIEKIASEWAEKEINTLEAATSELEKINNSRIFISEIKRIFELRQNPTANQQKFISQWHSAGFSIDLIHLAYEKTVEQINKVSFEYINKILMSWKENGYKTPDDVYNAESEYKKKRRNEASADGFNADKYKMFINNI